MQISGRLANKGNKLTDWETVYTTNSEGLRRGSYQVKVPFGTCAVDSPSDRQDRA